MFENGVPARKFKTTVVDTEDDHYAGPTDTKEQQEALAMA